MERESRSVAATVARLVAGPVLVAAMCVAVTSATASGSTTVSAAKVGHFLCYTETPATGSFHGAPSQVKLIDRWHAAAWVVKVHPSTTVCNTATKYVTGATFASPNPRAHLVCYGIQPSVTAFSKTLYVANQFGSGIKVLVGPVSTLCLPSWKSLTAIPTATTSQPPGLDHYSCYAASYPVGGATFNIPSSLAASDEFSTAHTSLQLSLPGQLCVPTTKILATASFPAHSLGDPSLLCFASSATPTKPKVYVRNQFGTGALSVHATKWFCVPSTVAGPESASLCDAMAKTVTTAVQAYDAQNAPAIIGWETRGTGAGDVNPGRPSSFGSATQARRLIVGQYLVGWPAPNDFAIALATGPASVSGSDAAARGAQKGDVMVYVPATSTTPVDYNLETQGNGCNSL
jgi:hypothetical protein